MALNPIAFTEKIVRSFLRYQLTTYPFADPRLLEQMRKQLSLGYERHAPLLRGPYISLSQAFRQGASIETLIRDGVFHPHLRHVIPERISHVYGHQERAIRSIHDGNTTLVSTGTGSGKTECFLYPIISKCLELRDANAAPGISAVIVYPMNALAEDQLDRLRGLLAGTQIPFAMYVGKTPETETQVGGYRLPISSSNADYWAKLDHVRREGRAESVRPAEEVCSREMLRTSGNQPRILLTNVKQLELLLTRSVDVQLFAGARLDFLVFDEAHTFTGAMGAETACLIRRLRAFCDRNASQTTCIATSATIIDDRDPNAARNFASRFFGVAEESVATVQEEYQSDEWTLSGIKIPEPKLKPFELLQLTLNAIDAEDPDTAIRQAYQSLVGQPLPSGYWSEALFDSLRSNDIAAKIRTELRQPRELQPLMHGLQTAIGRRFSEEELLCYLTLGAAARKDERPLLRPVVHAFIRGISGGVVSFPTDQEPQLSLNSEAELTRGPDADKLWRPRIHTCTTCGQHYFVSYLKDFSFTQRNIDGGQLAEGGSTYWEALDQTNGGSRVVFVDRLVSEAEDFDEDDNAPVSERLKTIHVCRYCGSAHKDDFSRCSGCGAISSPIRLLAVRTSDKHAGQLSSCISCGARGRPIGRRFREPVREVRAVNVSDVHVLAQDMVHHAERKRLLVFADNRQDAAFQAGWMKDHARRFRLRSLMAEVLRNAAGPLGVGELAIKLSDLLDADDSTSRALIPEVWRAAPPEGSGLAHAEERTYFLRIQVLREITASANQQIGLEPWGRLKIKYLGLSSSATFIRTWAQRLKMPQDDLVSGIEAVLDHQRRQRFLHDPSKQLFGRYWNDGDREIQRGYLPSMPGPKGMKLRVSSTDKKTLVAAWIGERNTLMREIARKWRVSDDAIVEFLEGLWQFLTSEDVRLLTPVTLLGSKGRAVPNCSGVVQIDSAKLTLEPNHGFYRCQRCRRKTLRRTPYGRCLAWQCDGELTFVPEEDKDNYNLQLLDQGYSMLRPEEHTAMVPQEQRERFENLFKGASDAVNTLVCTPTLELGVDIGALDTVLLRNVPPLPANYWQRAGRAGRRHRMAVTVTYCRPTSHDRAYFNDPVKMLRGRVDPPAFNLRNEMMVAKHVHAAILTRLNQLARSSALSDADRALVQQTLEDCFPRQISRYLFDTEGKMRVKPYSIAALESLIKQHRDDLLAATQRIFRQGWPEKDSEVTSDVALEAHIDRTADALGEVLLRLRRRLQWAFKELERLERIRIGERQGTLDKDDDAHYRRCDRLVKKLKGVQTRKRREADGVDDINTFNVLAMEGFLPGYGLESGSVIGMAEVPSWQMGSMDFELPRPSSVAIREYVPGNLIYANGHRFVARHFHFDVDQNLGEAPWFEVSTDRSALIETGLPQSSSTLSSSTLQAMAVCDVDLMHTSQISDDEETRFQMSVATYGLEQGRHNGGMMLAWGNRQVSLRRGVHLRLVNVGASSLVEQDEPELGYPVCLICGQSVSPLSAERQLEDFRTKHDERCHKRPSNIGFYADVVADCLTLPACGDQKEAYSVMECLRLAACSVLEMHVEDLQLLVIGHVDRDDVDALLWDPMPGGSGLLQQIVANFQRVFEAACEIARRCPSDCATSCVDCLQTFRNGFYHTHLDRHVALEKLQVLGGRLEELHSIPSSQPISAEHAIEHQPTNDAETKLKHMLQAAGFFSGRFQEQVRFKTPIKLNSQVGSTTPDVSFVSPADDPDDQGLCVYLDGLSSSIHGDPQTTQQDREIRDWLRNNGYQVIEISYVELDDQGAMIRHFRRIARYLEGRTYADQVGSDTSWFSN